MASIISASTTSGTALNMSADTTGVLQLATGASATTALTIDTSQNVGIGTTSPNIGSVSRALTINGSAGTIVELATSGTRQGWLYADTNLTAVSTGSGSQYLSFQTNGGNERMRIDSSGYTLIGTTSQLGGANNQLNIKAADIANTAYGLAIQNAATSTGGRFINFVNSSNTTNGYISQTNSSTVAYTTSSDYRLKENIKPLQNALDRVSLLKPVTFTWKESNDIGEGFIAHELAEIIPDAVCGSKDDIDDNGNPKYQGVDTSFIVATLTAAIQEQTIIINDLKARIETLEGAKL